MPAVAGPLASLEAQSGRTAVEARLPARPLGGRRSWPIEGELIVRLDCDGRRVRRVTVRSTRPMVAARVLTGKTAADAAATVPKLVQPLRQRAGRGRRECARRGGRERDSMADARGRDRDVMLESVQDAFRHLLIDWPNAMGSAPCATPVAAARFRDRVVDARGRWRAAARRCGGDARRWACACPRSRPQAIFGMPRRAGSNSPMSTRCVAWCAAARPFRRVAARPAAGRRADARPEHDPADAARVADALLRIVVPALRADPAFARAPTWAGAPVETGALARMRNDPLVAAVQGEFGNAVVTRIVARLAELARADRWSSTGTDARTGSAAADPGHAARRRRRARGGRDRARTAAAPRARARRARRRLPDRGADRMELSPRRRAGARPRRLEVDDERHLLRAARLAVHALDPCVASRIEVGHA